MKICIAHFRIGLTDGVSLQIDERAKILEQFGHKVFFISDQNSPCSDLHIPYLDYKYNLKIIQIQAEVFSGHVSDTTKEHVAKIAKEVELQLNALWEKNKFSLLFVHNFFSLPVCLPATIAFYDFLKSHPQIRAIAVHHDFYWDPPRIGKYSPSDSYTKRILKKYFPPKLPNLSHTVLSIWEKRKMKSLRNLNSDVITDTFDYDQPQWLKNASNKDFPKDIGLKGDELVLLLASRIRPRKGIELGIDFCAALSNLTPKKVILILPNDYHVDETKYVNQLKQKAKQLAVTILWVQELVGSEEEKRLGIKKYSLWDSYLYADAVLYPSLWEGFGNQFLEAVFAKKPIVYYEYPIFNTDLKPAGFKAISMGKVSDINKEGLAQVKTTGIIKAAKELLAILSNSKEYKKTIESNFRIAKNKFNTKIQIRKYLTDNSEKYIKTNGIRTIVSPLMLSSRLATCGILFQQSYDLAETIISEIPEGASTSDQLFALVANNLTGETRKRYVTIEVMKEFFISPKSEKPLFIFLGGLAGKTLMANFVVQQLGINQSISLDNEKLRIANQKDSKPYLWKATYESPEGYLKTITDLYPFILEKVQRCLFDYSRYKKWCYFLEGIYLSPTILKKLCESDKRMYYLNILNLPKYQDIKNQYLVRWQNELGVSVLKKHMNTFNQYLKNVHSIRIHLSKNIDSNSSYIIESSILEERLSIFYLTLYKKLYEIAEKEIPGWIEKIVEEPNKIGQYRKFLG
ncbi:hypothetical protein CO112_02065 [Candidatus Dojkabacteria bacterium CG_4_9_14_3_um_filter_150_Dojkabacteria_WS6_41_13]|uniref:Glycosyl transferase family 1 domain-containing protein n=1 Tax=Candidatus Dojkabacteria bacterium CG_4_10_14_0_2_um_filter_Dojkabacteria_WS6_41_15 TaxID=2014249 RepID=A0A2M7W2T9_9BACT|nr:MAG: hypothetical protein COX64_01410 [Candidatus Dojkabacteria bacterium CG_4_10_14_0_2_um_filter_Dojkabacteria_WS6_41_15]PJB22880.1 MAG: hypothetical protein CO112_02065 [Candidatus Dojkabacteria bacterium CG_4_9_14_3_um_filter_150_Dojkabacteria_WS6_41_13]